MIRVYLDWNAFSRLDHNDEVCKKTGAFLTDGLKYIIPYSHAHLLDIHRSYLKVGKNGINSKLDILEKYSKSLLISETEDDQLEFLNISVKKAMDMQIETYQNNKDLNFTFDDILEPFDLLKPLLNIKFPNPVTKTTQGSDDKNYKKLSNEVKKFMGESEEVSTAEIMHNISNMSSTLYEDDNFKNLRDNYQKGLNAKTGRFKDKRFDPKELLDEIAIEMKFSNFMALFDYTIKKIKKPSHYKKIIELCRLLDFIGFFSDVIKEGHHLDNIETDYKHIGYASTCDIFISSDNNTREKAKLAYHLLDFDIKVFTPKEFVEFVETNSHEFENGNEFIDCLFGLNSKPPSHISDNFNFYYISSNILNYFNCVCKLQNNDKHFKILKIGCANRIGTFIKEISSVYDKLFQFYGKPIFEKNKIGDDYCAFYWLTEKLMLIELKYSNEKLTIEFKQCYKLKGWKRIWNQIKIYLKKKYAVAYS
jgi:hypothetical protein